MLESPIIVLARSYFAILVARYELPSSNYIFELVDRYLVTLFTSLVDLLFYTILARNNTD